MKLFENSLEILMLDVWSLPEQMEDELGGAGLWLSMSE